MATRAAAAEELDTDLLLQTLVAFRAGDFSARMPETGTGVPGKIAEVLNEVIARNERLSKELARLRRGVGKEGRLPQRLPPDGSRGGGASSIPSGNDPGGDPGWPNTQTPPGAPP